MLNSHVKFISFTEREYIIYYSPIAATACEHSATSDFATYGIEILRLKAFESYSNGLNEFFFNLLNVLKV